MSLPYYIKYTADVLKYDIPALPGKVRELIKRAIEERLMTDPISYGKPLRYSLKGHRRLRVSDYRVVYRIDEGNKTVLILAIKHRKNIYEDA